MLNVVKAQWLPISRETQSHLLTYVNASANPLFTKWETLVLCHPPDRALNVSTKCHTMQLLFYGPSPGQETGWLPLGHLPSLSQLAQASLPFFYESSIRWCEEVIFKKMRTHTAINKFRYVRSVRFNWKTYHFMCVNRKYGVGVITESWNSRYFRNV